VRIFVSAQRSSTSVALAEAALPAEPAAVMASPLREIAARNTTVASFAAMAACLLFDSIQQG